MYKYRREARADIKAFEAKIDSLQIRLSEMMAAADYAREQI